MGVAEPGAPLSGPGLWAGLGGGAVAALACGSPSGPSPLHGGEWGGGFKEALPAADLASARPSPVAVFLSPAHSGWLGCTHRQDDCPWGTVGPDPGVY